MRCAAALSTAMRPFLTLDSGAVCDRSCHAVAVQYDYDTWADQIRLVRPDSRKRRAVHENAARSSRHETGRPAEGLHLLAAPRPALLPVPVRRGSGEARDQRE